MKLRFVLLTFVLTLTACGQANPTASVVQQDQPTVAAVATRLSTAVTVTTAVTSNPDWVNTVSIDGDFYVRGNPDAPIHLIDYSDFL